MTWYLAGEKSGLGGCVDLYLVGLCGGSIGVGIVAKNLPSWSLFTDYTTTPQKTKASILIIQAPTLANRREYNPPRKCMAITARPRFPQTSCSNNELLWGVGGVGVLHKSLNPKP